MVVLVVRGGERYTEIESSGQCRCHMLQPVLGVHVDWLAHSIPFIIPYFCTRPDDPSTGSCAIWMYGCITNKEYLELSW